MSTENEEMVEVLERFCKYLKSGVRDVREIEKSWKEDIKNKANSEWRIHFLEEMASILQLEWNF